MTTHQALPVSGYKSQSQRSVDLVNRNKETEERILRLIDSLGQTTTGDSSEDADRRWLAIARTHIEQGFMALNRAIFKPDRIDLLEDGGNPQSGV